MPRLAAKDGKFRFKLVLTTPAYFKECWRPDGFVRKIGQGWRGTLRASTTTHGTLELTGVTIIFACIGKTVRIGGWNLMYDKPRSLEGFIPASSVYFCEVDAGQSAQIAALHGAHLGMYSEYGFGHTLVGTWERNSQ